MTIFRWNLISFFSFLSSIIVWEIRFRFNTVVLMLIIIIKFLERKKDMVLGRSGLVPRDISITTMLIHPVSDISICFWESTTPWIITLLFGIFRTIRTFTRQWTKQLIYLLFKVTDGGFRTFKILKTAFLKKWEKTSLKSLLGAQIQTATMTTLISSLKRALNYSLIIKFTNETQKVFSVSTASQINLIPYWATSLQTKREKASKPKLCSISKRDLEVWPKTKERMPWEATKLIKLYQEEADMLMIILISKRGRVITQDIQIILLLFLRRLVAMLSWLRESILKSTCKTALRTSIQTTKKCTIKKKETRSLVYTNI